MMWLDRDWVGCQCVRQMCFLQTDLILSTRALLGPFDSFLTQLYNNHRMWCMDLIYFFLRSLIYSWTACVNLHLLWTVIKAFMIWHDSFPIIIVMIWVIHIWEWCQIGVSSSHHHHHNTAWALFISCELLEGHWISYTGNTIQDRCSGVRQQPGAGAKELKHRQHGALSLIGNTADGHMTLWSLLLPLMRSYHKAYKWNIMPRS